MLEGIKNFGNITLPHHLSEKYGDVDGLSLQNLFYARNGFFPGCYLFDFETRTNGDYKFDTKKIAKYLFDNIPEDEHMEFSPYYTNILGSKEDDIKLGFCVILNKSNLYARFERSVTESYILFDNAHIDELDKFVEAILQFYIAPEGEENNIWRLCSSNTGFYLDKGKIKVFDKFEISKLYNNGFEEEDKKICDFIAEDDKSGLVILHGDKGTGKTSYIKHLVNIFPNRKFVYVPASMINLLGEPSFGSFLITLNNHVIVLEDCENAIRDRKANGSASAVSLLLNMTDGLLSDDLGMKFICTFNEDMKNIDPALLRKGRLMSKYEFKALSIDKAKELLFERGIENPQLDKPLTLAEIFHYEDTSYETTKKSII
jgi:hypothetical protein